MVLGCLSCTRSVDLSAPYVMEKHYAWLSWLARLSIRGLILTWLYLVCPELGKALCTVPLFLGELNPSADSGF